MKKSKNFFFSVISPGEGTYTSLHQKYTCVGINIMSLAIILINAIAGPYFFKLTQQVQIYWGCAIEAICIFLVMVLNSQKLYEFANMFFFLILNGATVYFATILGRDVNAQLMILYLLGLAIFLFEDLWLQVCGMLIAAVNLILLEGIFDQSLIASLSFDDHTKTLMRRASYASISILVVMLFYYYSIISRKDYFVALKDKNILQNENVELATKVSNALVVIDKKRLLFATAVHEIRNTVDGVNALARRIEEMSQDQPNLPFDSHIDLLKSGCLNVIRLINDYMSIARNENNVVENINLTEVDIKKEIFSLIAEYNSFAVLHNTSISFSHDERLPEKLITDTLKIRQIVLNLLHNAIKNVSAGKEVFVSVELVGFGDWSISVTNEGKRIPDEVLNTMFDPFKSSHFSKGGTGIGMYVAKNLANLLHGEIYVRRRKEKFTVFEVVFPLEFNLVNPEALRVNP